MDREMWITFFGNLRVAAINAALMLGAVTFYGMWHSPAVIGGYFFFALMAIIIVAWVVFFATVQRDALTKNRVNEANPS